MYFQRGALTPEQTRLVLRDLPIDVSFADENDVLVYWSGSIFKTCDARYIGRDVRDCHHEDTLDSLDEILREFKAGTRAVAEGWEQNGERFTYTSYTAVRDDAGAYKGVLEVHHDVTRMRALEGAQALPGW